MTFRCLSFSRMTLVRRICSWSLASSCEERSALVETCWLTKTRRSSRWEVRSLISWEACSQRFSFLEASISTWDFCSVFRIISREVKVFECLVTSRSFLRPVIYFCILSICSSSIVSCTCRLILSSSMLLASVLALKTSFYFNLRPSLSSLSTSSCSLVFSISLSFFMT